MQRVAEAGHALHLVDVRVLRKHARHAFHRAHEYAAEPGKPGGNRRLHRFRRAEIGEAGGQRARRDAVLDQRHHHGVEKLRLPGIGNAAHQLEERHVAEIQVAEDLAGQVLAAHHDAVDGGPGELGADGLGHR